ncbi:MAG: GWxTD domain-containing protein, partial [Balneolaceae bacterium]|nr:GWxTD domain-containing protein [Balneolaceae bacterium]
KPEELAAPLAYLMGRRDYERLISIENSDSLRSAIDNFWLSNIEDADRARRVIALYYERVEEANKQFSNFKEGWKTDMGMIYILFGPPLFTKRYLGGWIWSYSYDIANPEYHFRFIRPRTRRDPSFPFDHYLLERESGSFNIQSRQIHLWLSGNILEVSLAKAYQIGTGSDNHLSCGYFHFLCS